MRRPAIARMRPVAHPVRFRLKAGAIPTIFRKTAPFAATGRFEMANWTDPQPGSVQPTTTAGRAGVAVDAGLRSYMLSVYNYMASAVLLTGIVAYAFAASGAVNVLFNPVTGGASLLGYVAIFAPLGIVLWMSFGINRLSTGMAQVLYWAYAALLGVSLSTIFLVYTQASIALTFFATAAAFASLSLYGYTTQRDLSGMGTFLLMGLVGIIVASIVNLFWMNDTFSLVIAALGVLIFAGLTAYDTQKIKSIYFQVAGSDFIGKAAIMGALSLYLDFINMFLFLLRFLGNRN
jgi:FtsH-binding integral membrane protein